MHVLKTENLYSWLITEDRQLKYHFWKALRFLDPDRFHKSAYKNRRWDGYKDFFSLQSGMFLTGLMPEVMYGLKKLNQPYKLIDSRNKINWILPSIDQTFLTSHTPKSVYERDGKAVTLHDYQADLVNQTLKFNRGIITAPTGAGKTWIMISILKLLPPGTKVLFMTKASGLVDQNYRDMQEWGIPNLGRWYGDYKEEGDVMCVTIHQDTFASIEHMFPKFQVVIVDEVHECLGDVAKSGYVKLKNAGIRLGVSATPFKKDGKDILQKFTLKGFFGGVFKTTTTESGILTTKNLQERGILSPSNCTFYPIYEPKTIKNEPYIDAVKLGIADNFYFHDVVKRLARSLKGRTIIMVERTDQGEYLKSLMPEAHWIRGKVKLKDREAIYKELKVGENVICIAMRHIITAGINVYIHNLINAAGGNAEHSTIQQIGRGLRCASDKEILEFYDFIYKTNDYLEDHSENRIKTLADQGHHVTIKEAIDF